MLGKRFVISNPSLRAYKTPQRGEGDKPPHKDPQQPKPGNDFPPPLHELAYHSTL